MQEHETLNKEELAYLIKAVWEALQAPSWSKDDLIEFGKAIFGKTALKDLDPKKFNRLFPFLKTIAEHLGTRLKEAVLPTPPTAPDEKCKPSSPPATIPEISPETPPNEPEKTGCPSGHPGPIGPSGEQP